MELIGILRKEQLGLWFVILIACFCSSLSYNLYVGGKDGWRIDPTENYNHWAERNRFQLNDTIIFKFKKGQDSVLLVEKDDYYKCHKSKPLQSLNDDELGSEFKIDRSGPLFFISGHADNCEKGEKLSVIVLTPRTRPSPHQSPSPSPSPPLPPTTQHQLAPVPAPAKSAASMASSFGLLLAFVMAMAFAVLN